MQKQSNSMDSTPSKRAGKGAPHHGHGTHVKDMIETFLIKLKRGTFHSNSEISMTLSAAKEATMILRTIVEHYADHVREKGGVLGLRSPSKKQLSGMGERKFSIGFASTANVGHGLDKHSLPPGVREVVEVINQITKAGKALQRASAFRLLLANVARRVLFIIRECAASSTTTIAALEAQHISEEEAALGYPSGSGSGESEVGSDFETEHQPLPYGEHDDEELEPSSPPQAISGGGAQQSRKERSPPSVSFPKSLPKAVNNEGEFPATSWRQDSSSEGTATDFVGHTPPTDGTMLTRVESTVGVDFSAAMRAAAQAIGCVSVGGDLQPIDFNDFIDKTLCGIIELESEYERMTATLCEHASKQLYNGEVVLTLGCSHTMINFLLTAAKSKSFRCIILEGAPMDPTGAKKMAQTLEAKGIETRVLPDSSCFAVMSQASKVFVSTDSVLANGGLLASIGTHPLCIAAKHFSVPVVTVTTSLKLCPYYPSDNECSSLVKISKTEAQEVPWSTYACPFDVLGEQDWRSNEPAVIPELIVDNPVLEYVPPNLISLFVTNDGEHTVPQIHRLVRDHYHVEDGAI